MPVPSHNVLTCKTKISRKTKCQFCKNDNLFCFTCSHRSRVIFVFMGKENWVKHSCKEREETLLMKFIRKERFNTDGKEISYVVKKYIIKQKFEFINTENIHYYIDKEYSQYDLLKD